MIDMDDKKKKELIKNVVGMIFYTLLTFAFYRGCTAHIIKDNYLLLLNLFTMVFAGANAFKHSVNIFLIVFDKYVYEEYYEEIIDDDELKEDLENEEVKSKNKELNQNKEITETKNKSKIIDDPVVAYSKDIKGRCRYLNIKDKKSYDDMIDSIVEKYKSALSISINEKASDEAINRLIAINIYRLRIIDNDIQKSLKNNMVYNIINNFNNNDDDFILKRKM